MQTEVSSPPRPHLTEDPQQEAGGTAGNGRPDEVPPDAGIDGMEEEIRAFREVIDGEEGDEDHLPHHYSLRFLRSFLRDRLENPGKELGWCDISLDQLQQYADGLHDALTHLAAHLVEAKAKGSRPGDDDLIVIPRLRVRR